MIDRRLFLHSLVGAATVVTLPKTVTYVFAPPGGWVLGQRVYTFSDVVGVLAPSTFTRMLDETDTQLHARIACELIRVKTEFEVRGLSELVQALRTRRDKEWFL